MATAVKERPILFSGPMVRAILDGRKTQTRRIVKPQPQMHSDSDAAWRDAKADLWRNARQYARDCCPYGSVGDLLWVRETFRAIEDPAADDSEVRKWGVDDMGDPARIVVDYKADNPQRIMDKVGKPEWKPSIHMPRWASRILLELTSVRVERLQEISEADAIAEGVRSDILPACGDHPDLICYVAEPDDNHAYQTATQAFRKTWENINGPDSWDANPFVWVISFRRIESERDA